MILQQYFCIPHNISRIDLVLATFTHLFTYLQIYILTKNIKEALNKIEFQAT